MSIKPIIARIGGKWFCNKKVIALFPENYDSYIEPFVGGGSVFFNSPKKEVEVINDLDSQLIDLYHTCKERPIEVEAKEYTEEDFIKIKEQQPTDVRSRVIRTLLMQRISHFGIGNYHRERRNIAPAYNTKYKQHHERLQHTIICNKDYKEIISTYDSPSSFFYLDPPYENSKINVRQNLYTDIDLEELRNIVTCIKGKFLLSLNDSEKNRNLFREFTIDVITTTYGGRTKKDRHATELIIKNY